MDIYIGKYNGHKILGLIVAKSEEIAWTYFEGKYGNVSDVEKINIKELNSSRPYYNIIETFEFNYNITKDPVRTIKNR